MNCVPLGLDFYIRLRVDSELRLAVLERGIRSRRW